MDQLTDRQATQLWQSLYLDREQIEQLLNHIKQTSPYPFLYPISLFAAHARIRRSELCRSRVADIDLEARTAVIQERKRSRTKRTTRVVPLSMKLAEVSATACGQG